MLRRGSILFVLAVVLSSLSCSQKKKTTGTDTGASTTTTAPAEVTKSDVTIGLNLGNQAPEIEQNDPNGKMIKLSSLRGKVVLIDFWASWCGPCRFENPAVVKAYNLYKDRNFTAGKGLTVYSVSLDNRKDAWTTAIQKDNLTWPYHVSDLMGWNSAPAASYGVSSIPANFLINEKGIIINKNLRGEDLIAALEKLTVK